MQRRQMIVIDEMIAKGTMRLEYGFGLIIK